MELFMTQPICLPVQFAVPSSKALEYLSSQAQLADHQLDLSAVGGVAIKSPT